VGVSVPAVRAAPSARRAEAAWPAGSAAVSMGDRGADLVGASAVAAEVVSVVAAAVAVVGAVPPEAGKGVEYECTGTDQGNDGLGQPGGAMVASQAFHRRRSRRDRGTYTLVRT